MDMRVCKKCGLIAAALAVEGWVLVVKDGRVRLMRPCGFSFTVR